ncbi:MAG: GTP 3',8-cyclase MoaA [Cellulosilyticaceae bacterium]
MRDGQGRQIGYLRVSVTDRCNSRCIYCMPEEGLAPQAADNLLTYDEIERICKAGAELGLKKIKLTGGEPLVRKELHHLVRTLKNIKGIEKVTLTTNGMLLKQQLPLLVEAGIDGINISLDTLDPKAYARITRRDALQNVLESMEALKDYPHIPLKINCVPITTEPSDLLQLVQLAKEEPIHIRFIEMMPIGYGKTLPSLKEEEITALLQSTYGTMVPYDKRLGEGPCRYYSLPDFKGKIGFISAISHQFCGSCNRVRLTSEGYLKACLQYNAGCDLKTLLRTGCSESTLRDAMEQAIINKPMRHHFYEQKTGKEEHRAMSQIGG